MINVPIEISDDIMFLCNQLESETPVFVPITPRPDLETGFCHYNSSHIAAGIEGEVIFGWAIYEEMIGEQPVVVAQFHSVVGSSRSIFDPTPNEINSEKILFSIDRNRVYDFKKRYSWSNVYLVIGPKKLLIGGGGTFDRWIGSPVRAIAPEEAISDYIRKINSLI